MINIAVFASGSGTNAENLVRYFKGHQLVEIRMILCDRKNAFVFERMKSLNMPAYYMPSKEFENGNVLKLLREQKIDWIILAGFLKLMPPDLIRAFSNRIINIHPALLPKFGGKGMYGMHVHEAVIEAGDSVTGITVHFVNENFDEGEIIQQVETIVETEDDAAALAAKIHTLEMKWFPVIAEKIICGNRS